MAPRSESGNQIDEMTPCPVCFEDSFVEEGSDKHYVECMRCGKFQVGGTAMVMLPEELDHSSSGRRLLGRRGSRRRANASAWLRANAGPGFMLRDNDFDWFARIETPPVSVRTDRLLVEVSEATDAVGKEIDIGTIPWEPKAWALNRDELVGLAEILQQSNLIEIGTRTLGSTGQIPVRITAKGWSRLEEQSRTDSELHQAFVAMWFRPSLMRLYADAIEPAILAAGYSPFRVDIKPHTERIDDRIMAEIRRSRFVVADYTGHRGGVYYETGFAHGLGKDVIFTCCKRHMKDLHFDIRQYNCISWRSRADLRARLEDAIVGAIGVGPLSGDGDSDA